MALSVRGCIEVLERRDLLTTTLFLDFGAGIGFDSLGQQNSLQTTVGDFRNIDGQGIDGNGTGTTLPSYPTNPDGWLEFRPTAYDWDNSGLLDAADISGLSAQVLSNVRRALEPYDIDVVIASAATLDDAVAALHANDLESQKTNDAYLFVTEAYAEYAQGGSVGIANGHLGAAAGDDLLAKSGNRQDEAALVYTDSARTLITVTPGTEEYNRQVAHRLASTSIHEAFHTFGFDHTFYDGNSGPNLVANGDMIQSGATFASKTNHAIVTRYSLVNTSNFTELNNNYMLAATDPNFGLRDNDDDELPDLAYITGTGANDLITINLDPADNNLVNVTVSPFDDAERTVPSQTLATPTVLTYSIHLDGGGANPWENTEGGFLIDSSHGDDRIEIDAAIAGDFRVRTSLGDDEIVLVGSPTPRIRSFIVEGEAGDDQLIFDYTSGNPIPLAGFDFAFDGGEGIDSTAVIELDISQQPVTRPAYFVDTTVTTDFSTSDVPTISIASTLADAADTNTTDGVADASGDAGDQITLRAAVQEANLAGEPAYIFLPSADISLSLEGTETGNAAANDLDVTGDVTIVGAGAGVSVIEGFDTFYTGPADEKQIFHVSGSAGNLDLSRVTLTGTETITAGLRYGGGGVRADSGATFLLTDSAVDWER